MGGEKCQNLRAAFTITAPSALIVEMMGGGNLRQRSGKYASSKVTDDQPDVSPGEF